MGLQLRDDAPAAPRRVGASGPGREDVLVHDPPGRGRGVAEEVPVPLRVSPPVRRHRRRVFLHLLESEAESDESAGARVSPSPFGLFCLGAICCRFPSSLRSAVGGTGKPVGHRKEDLRLTRMMLLIFVAFLACFLPLMLVNVADEEVRRGMRSLNPYFLF